MDGATKAAEFYRRAFGAQVVAAHPVDDKGRTMHVHLHINGSSVMLCDSYPEFGHPSEKPQAFNLTLMVDDIDAWWRRAVDAGAEIVMPVARNVLGRPLWPAPRSVRGGVGMNQPTHIVPVAGRHVTQSGEPT